MIAAIRSDVSVVESVLYVAFELGKKHEDVFGHKGHQDS